MVAGKPKTEKSLRKELSQKGYRLRHGYNLVKCKRPRCGMKKR